MSSLFKNCFSKVRSKIALITSLVLVTTSQSFAQENPKNAINKQVTAVRADSDTIWLDGRLDESIWTTALTMSNFIQKEPVEGAPPTDLMTVKFLYDDDALYVGAHMHAQSREWIQAPLGRRDDVRLGEYIMISLDTFLDRRTAYTFGVTASGVRLDHFHPEDREWHPDREFDPVWKAQTVITDKGWTAEMRIPFSQLRFNNKPSQIWGINVKRWIPSRNEEVYWVMIPRTVRGWASRFGQLHGIHGLPPSYRVELFPYVGGRSTFTSTPNPANPFDNRIKFSGRAGADIKIGLGPNLTFEATVNPDFGQIEADPAEVNLSAFETFFRERRPFFIEGNRLLSSRVVDNYYYSRRIGARPKKSVSGDFTDYPLENTILGASKLTGRLTSGTSFAFLGAVTDEEFARTADKNVGEIQLTRVSPRSMFAIGRVEQEFGPSVSTASLMVTAVHRDVTKGDSLSELFARDALTANGDALLRFKEGEYELGFQGGMSYLRGEPGAIQRIQESPVRLMHRPDITYTNYDPNRTQLVGGKGGATFGRTSGRHWLWSSRFDVESPELELNDIGRLSRGDGIQLNNRLTYRETVPGKLFRAYRIGVRTRTAWNFGLDRQTNGYGMNGSTTWPNFWRSELSVNIDRRAQDHTLTRGGPSMETPNGWRVRGELRNNSASNTRWESEINYGRDEDGGLIFDAEAEISLRPRPRLELSVNPSYSREIFTQQYITTLARSTQKTFGARYIFSHVDRSTFVMRTRLNYTFKPDLTIDMYAEPFAASGDFFNHGELATPRTRQIHPYTMGGLATQLLDDDTLQVTDGRETFTFANKDFNVLSFRSNIVLRWEWQPGSTVFFVWQQDRFNETTRGQRLTGRDLLRTFTAQGQDIFLIKASFWFPIG